MIFLSLVLLLSLLISIRIAIKYKKQENAAFLSSFYYGMKKECIFFSIYKKNVYISNSFSELIGIKKSILSVDDFLGFLKEDSIKNKSNKGEPLRGLENLKKSIERMLRKKASFRQCIFIKEKTYEAKFIILSDVVIALFNESNLQDIEFYKTIIDALPIAVLFQNKNQNITFCNNTYSQITESSKLQIVDQNIHIKLYKKNLQEIIKSARLNKMEISEKCLTSINGDRRFLEVTIIPLLRGDIVMFSDKTEILIQKNEYNLKKRELFKLIDKISSSVAIFDEKTKLSYFNKAYLELFEFNEDWLRTNPTLSEILEELKINKKLPELIDFKKYKQKRLSLFEEFFTQINEITHLADGKIIKMSIFPHALDSNRSGIVYIFDDITKNLNTERELNGIISIQSTIFDKLSEGIFIIGSDYKITFANKLAKEFFKNIKSEKIRGCKIENGEHFTSLTDKLSEIDKIDWKQRLLNLIDKRISANFLINNNEISILLSYSALPNGMHLISIEQKINQKLAV